MSKPAVVALLLMAALGFGGCSLVVDFDRALLVDAGPDGEVVDASLDGAPGSDGAVDAGAADAD